MDTLSRKDVRVKKPHACWGCTRVFPIGSWMTRDVIREGRKLRNQYWCSPCLSWVIEHFEALAPEIDEETNDFYEEPHIGFGDVPRLKKELEQAG